MSDLRDIHGPTEGNLLAFGTVCLDSAGLAEGTNAATIKTANAIDYAIDGILYTKAATDNIALTAGTAQADGTTAYYLICIDSAGTVSSVQGEDDGDIPAATADTCPIGCIKVVTSGGTFTAGTTDLGDAAVTDTYYNFLAIPPNGASDLS